MLLLFLLVDKFSSFVDTHLQMFSCLRITFHTFYNCKGIKMYTFYLFDKTDVLTVIIFNVISQNGFGSLLQWKYIRITLTLVRRLFINNS